MFNTILDKYATPAVDDKSLATLTRDNALEASADVWAEKKKLDSFEAMSQVKNVFSKFWAEHDITQKNVIDNNEAYSLL